MIKRILTCVILCASLNKPALAPAAIFAGSTIADRNDSAGVIKSITGFLHWYKINLHMNND